LPVDAMAPPRPRLAIDESDVPPAPHSTCARANDNTGKPR